ncbi:MAG: hypothetical protein KAT34_20040 [Candidatus Aminicenantes bacterium]|nr:hypothetical protein [Candidatus Aminicenantes bacterium]
MKKLMLIAILTLSLLSWGVSADFSVNLNMNYNHGIADFFEQSQLPLSYMGMNFIEKKQNNMGLGFNLSINVPILKRLYLVPGASMNFGHRQYEYTQVDTWSTGANNVKDTHYFKIYSGELSLQYDLLVLKNGWYFSLLFGLNYNYFTADNEMMMEDEKYWGTQTEVMARFLQLKHLGFQAAFFYRKPFSADFASFIGGRAGIFYRF